MPKRNSEMCPHLLHMHVIFVFTYTFYFSLWCNLCVTLHLLVKSMKLLCLCTCVNYFVYLSVSVSLTFPFTEKSDYDKINVTLSVIHLSQTILSNCCRWFGVKLQVLWFFSLFARLLALCHIYLILLGIWILDEGEQLKEGGGAA